MSCATIDKKNNVPGISKGHRKGFPRVVSQIHDKHSREVYMLSLH